MKGINERQEYPRPDFERKQWMSLNGEWEFSFDDDDLGEIQKWHLEKKFISKIMVPFCFQSKMSGIHDTGLHPNMWYQKKFDLPESFLDKRILLNFGAVDYVAKVWINGIFLGKHQGGYTPFQWDITGHVLGKDNILVVKAEDDYDCEQPRGKQYWKEKPEKCWYTSTSGIWQSVWIETTGDSYINKIKLTPDIDRRVLQGEVCIKGVSENSYLSIDLSYQGKSAGKISLVVEDKKVTFLITIKEEDFIDEIHYWTPETPNLYDIFFTITKNGIKEDEVKSYFGMRKISVKNDLILLNNKPFYQKLVLDQGYWKDSLMTPPSDEAIKLDILMTKELGFNGARKHQKIEDPRYYYWADKLGLVVWEEFPSTYKFTDISVENCIKEWIEIINRDYNHPCIITWVPLNESWGVRNIVTDENQQKYAETLYYMTKTLDATRLVNTNDGWEQINKTDICGIHDYAADGSDFIPRYLQKDKLLQGDAQGRLLFCNGNEYQGQPIIISEFGGISFESEDSNNFGYSGFVKTQQEFVERYESLMKKIQEIPYVRGFCYTQLTDVMQETNGLLTSDRKRKNLEFPQIVIKR